MKPNSIPSHSILRRTRTRNDRSLTLNFKTKKKIRKQKINQEKKKMVLRVRLVYMLYIYIHTYIGTYLLYIHEVILSIISLSLKRKPLRVLLFLLPMKSQRGEEKSERKKKVRAKKKKEKKKKETRFILYLPIQGRWGFLFLSFSFLKKMY